MKKFYKYTKNVTTVKRYGNNFIRIQTMNVQRTPFTEHTNSDIDRYDTIMSNYHDKDELQYYDLFSAPELPEHTKRLDESIIRSRRLVFEYAMSNDWDFFCTFTIDKNKFDRYNLEEYHTKLSQWFRNYFRRKLGYDVQYILIPEEHKDGAWHEHGLFRNFPKSELTEFNITQGKLPSYILNKLTKGEKIYNCPAYQKKFGFCTFEPVRNSEACAKYITKYITKDIATSSIEKGHKLYYVSRKLKRAENIAIGTYCGVPFYDFSNDYGSYATFAYSEEFARLLENKIEKM